MKCTKNNEKIKRSTQKIINKHPLIQECVNAITTQGGSALLVGGAVRDILLGLPVKDIDIEVYGLSLNVLENILQQVGVVRSVGKAFGVLRIDGLDVDWSLPRADSSGRKPNVVIDPTMDFDQAFRRRDLTINAMGIDLSTYELIDPFNGFNDLKQGILRAPDSELFAQDPLRLFRVMQFISRFKMIPDRALEKICKIMDISSVSRERIAQEFTKLLLLSEQPSLGIRWLQSIGRLKEIVPELDAMERTPQRSDYHPEGDVFEHAMQTLDAAAQIEYGSTDETLIQLWAALLHDCGKIDTTKRVDGVLKSIGHAEVGAPIVRKILKRLTNNSRLSKAVEALVYYHMEPLGFIGNNARASAYKKLASKLHPNATLAMLANLWLADRRGRNPKRGSSPLIDEDKEVVLFIDRAKKAGVLDAPEPAVLCGSDLKNIVVPGVLMGKILKKAYAIQIEKGVTDKAELRKRAMQGIVN